MLDEVIGMQDILAGGNDASAFAGQVQQVRRRLPVFHCAVNCELAKVKMRAAPGQLPQFDVDSVDELPDEKFDDFLVLLEASFYPGEAKEMSP